jgi:hypothetical protein
MYRRHDIARLRRDFWAPRIWQHAEPATPKPGASCGFTAGGLDGIVTALSKFETTGNNGVATDQYQANRDMPAQY